MSWFRKQPEPLLTAPIAPDWTVIDRDNLKRFFESKTGKKLVERYRAVEFVNSKNACADSLHTSHSAGRAAGFSDGLKWLLSLSVATAAQPQIDSRAFGETQPVEPELDDVLARLSP